MIDKPTISLGNLCLQVDGNLDNHQKLWRYMELSKFIYLIDNSSLWLARADSFKDKHEGRFPDDMRKTIERAYGSFKNDDPPKVKDADDFQDYLRKNTYINCWHKNFDENMVMWEIYGKDINAIAIQTTVEKMKASLGKLQICGHSLILKNVSYQRADEIPGVLPYEECFFIKRPHFSFEEEVRISLDTYSPINPTKKTPYGHHLSVCINKLIEKIFIHPDSPDWFLEVVNSIVKKYQVKAPVVRGLCGNRE